jgi:NADH-quinone oxidoreductase subunit F
VCLSGHVQRPGVYEVALGSLSLRELIFDSELGGGVKNGGLFKFAHLGGQSGAIASEASLDVIYSYSDMKEAGLAVGSGAVVVMDQSVPILDYLLSVTRFFIHESCGKCIPCREGNPALLRFIERLKLPGGLASEELPSLNSLLSAMRRASFCGLGQSAGVAFASARKAFSEEVLGRALA